MATVCGKRRVIKQEMRYQIERLVANIKLNEWGSETIETVWEHAVFYSAS